MRGINESKADYLKRIGKVQEDPKPIKVEKKLKKESEEQKKEE